MAKCFEGLNTLYLRLMNVGGLMEIQSCLEGGSASMWATSCTEHINYSSRIPDRMTFYNGYLPPAIRQPHTRWMRLPVDEVFVYYYSRLATWRSLLHVNSFVWYIRGWGVSWNFKSLRLRLLEWLKRFSQTTWTRCDGWWRLECLPHS